MHGQTPGTASFGPNQENLYAEKRFSEANKRIVIIMAPGSELYFGCININIYKYRKYPRFVFPAVKYVYHSSSIHKRVSALIKHLMTRETKHNSIGV